MAIPKAEPRFNNHVFRAGERYVFAPTYGADIQWVKTS